MEILTQGGNGVVLIASTSEAEAREFLQRELPLPEGWQWQFDGSDACYSDGFWFSQKPPEGFYQPMSPGPNRDSARKGREEMKRNELGR